MIKQLKKSLIFLLMIVPILASSCATNGNVKPTPLQYYKLRVHYMNEGDKAPFDGYLMNKYTWQQVTKKLKACKELKKTLKPAQSTAQ